MGLSEHLGAPYLGSFSLGSYYLGLFFGGLPIFGNSLIAPVHFCGVLLVEFPGGAEGEPLRVIQGLCRVSGFGAWGFGFRVMVTQKG